MKAYFRSLTSTCTDTLLKLIQSINLRVGTLLMPFILTGCLMPSAAAQNAAKVVLRAKPVLATKIPAPTTTPVPTATLAPTATPVPTSTPVPASIPAPIAQALSIATVGGEWQFTQSALEAAAGEEIALSFKNNAKMTPHNLVLVSGGDDIALAVNTAGASAGAAMGYIPSDPRIIAHTTGLVKGGHAETITFSAPAAGTYTYICTVPGHLELGMKGILIVKRSGDAD
jgi:azurin